MFKLIIDTDKYSGNFEREMCSYITGAFDETMVGSELADTFKTEAISEQIKNSVLYTRHKEFDFDTPACIMTTPNRVNNGLGVNMDASSIEAQQLPHTYDAYESVGISFKENPMQYIEILKERAFSFGKDFDIKIVGFRLIETETTINTINTNIPL